ncbi:MAG TPA: DUF488 family protein [Burkholderiaceae bacterium]|nr:DUF488 family protein [Burkholderiaceae bacterium]
MAIRIVQLGSARHPAEGLRIGTVRRPPRGVPKSEFAKRNYYDTWLPELSPSLDLMKKGLQAQKSGNDRLWAAFERGFRTQMKQPQAARTLDLLAALSHQTNFSLGCYCNDERRCHRSVLRALLAERRAAVA